MAVPFLIHADAGVLAYALSADFDEEVLEALRLWARDELRSANGQIEYILRRALMDAGRLKAGARRKEDDPG